jgi:hypothetical protein
MKNFKHTIGNRTFIAQYHRVPQFYLILYYSLSDCP